MPVVSELLTITAIPRPTGFEPLSKEVAVLYGKEVYGEDVDDALFNKEYVGTLQQGITVAAFDVIGNIVGAGTIATNPQGDKELSLLAVSPSNRRQGVGKNILKVLETICVESGVNRLKVTTIESAYNYYKERAGFVPVDEDTLVKELS